MGILGSMIPAALWRAAQRIPRLAGGILLVAFLVMPRLLHAADPVNLEYKVKAGYLFNFAKVVEWPAAALPTAEAPIVVGVIDNGDVLSVMRGLMAGKSIQGHPIRVESVSPDSLARGHHILFVPKGSGVTPEQVRAALGDSPTLVVGESEGFAERGGMINFVKVENNVKFEVNTAAAQRAALKLGSQLLKLAILVRDNPAARRD